MFTNNRYRLHLIPLFILLSYYLLSLFFFNSIVLVAHDNLEIKPVYNHVISQILKGNFKSYEMFISGEFKWYYLYSIFEPLNLIQLVLNDKQFYFFKEILFKIISYFSFFIFAKKFFKNERLSVYGSLFYTVLINSTYISPTLFLPILPYLFYLIAIKSHYNHKHYFIIFLSGLSSSLVFDYLVLISLVLFYLFIKKIIFTKKTNNYKNLYYFLFLFSLGTFFTSIPLFLSVMGEPIHRSLIKASSDGGFQLLYIEFKSLIDKFLLNNLNDLFYFPILILKIIILSFFLFTKNKLIKLFSIFIILIFLIKIFVLSNFFSTAISIIPFLKGFNFSRISNINFLLYCILLVAIICNYKNYNFSKYIIYLTIFASICSQIYLPLEEFTKEVIKKNIKENILIEIKNNYKNRNIINIILTLKNKNNYNYDTLNFEVSTKNSFDNYYNFEVYKKIKSIVDKSRVGSIGISPMIAVMSDISVIDGYHNIYPLHYKKKFRKIIEDELNQDSFLKDYFDNWGNRVFLFYKNQDNILINFAEAKKLGAEFIISSFPLNNINLEPNCLICGENNNIYLYKII